MDALHNPPESSQVVMRFDLCLVFLWSILEDVDSLIHPVVDSLAKEPVLDEAQLLHGLALRQFFSLFRMVSATTPNKAAT